MARQAQVDKRKAILKARGVPERFIDNIARRKLPFGFLFAILAGFVVFIAAIVGLLYFSDTWQGWLATYLYPEAGNSLLAYSSTDLVGGVLFGLTVIGFVVYVLALMNLASLKARPFPAYSPVGVGLYTLKPGETLDTLFPNPNYAKYADLIDDQAFLNAVAPPRPPAWLKIFIPIVLLPVLLPLLGILSTSHDYKAIDLGAVRFHVGGRTLTYRLADAEYAYVLCYSGERGGRFDYRLQYPKRTISLWNYNEIVHHLSEEQIAGRLARIDARLAQLHVPIHRMPVTDSPHYDAVSCVQNISRSWSPQGRKTLEHLVFGD